MRTCEMSQSPKPSVPDGVAKPGPAHASFAKTAFQRTLRCLKCVRYKDPIKVLGPTLVGLACAAAFPPTAAACYDMLILLLGGYVLMAHCFAVNDWTDGIADSCDSRKAGKAYLNRGVTDAEMLVLTIVLGVASLLIIGSVGYQLLPLAVTIVACSFVYSFPHPRFEGKQIPLLSTFMHGITGILMFLLGYCLWAGFDPRGVMIGVYFALIYEAGHLILEVRDFEGDRDSGIRTYAVRYGPRPVFAAAAAASLAAGLLLGFLALTGDLPYVVAFVALLYLPVLFMFWRLRKSRLDFDEVRAMSKSFVNIHTAIWGLLLLFNLVL